MQTDATTGKEDRTSKRYAIALRTNKALYQRIEALAKEQNISINLAVNMLLGFAFNEVDRQKKKFVPRVVFETTPGPKQ